MKIGSACITLCFPSYYPFVYIVPSMRVEYSGTGTDTNNFSKK